MKMITAVIKPFRLDEVRNVLSETGITRMTLTEVRGIGRQKGHTEHYRGAEYSVDFITKIKSEVAVQDNQAEAVTEAIMQAAQTGKVGDGKIFVTDIEKTVRIRTSELNNDAL